MASAAAAAAVTTTTTTTTIIIIIIIFFFTIYEFFTPVLPDVFSLKSEWQQVSSGQQDSSEYSN